MLNLPSYLSTALSRADIAGIAGPEKFMHEDAYDHSHIPDEAREELARYIWGQEALTMTTVGIDIGSSTSHLLFATITLQRQSQSLSSRFVVTKRDILWRSPIMLTPFLSDGTIDAAALDAFLQDSYRAAGLARGDVDSGAVILTGEAIKRKNAKAIDELFAEEAGKFVCATAGHRLECTLAAHGSGAVAFSREKNICLLHVDIGGGTTKMALIDRGVIVGVSAFAVGGRLIARDSHEEWTRIDDTARLVAKDIGLEASPATFADPMVRKKIAQRLAGVIADYISGAPPDPLGASLLLTESLPRGTKPAMVSFSGGVSEYLFGREQRDFGDIAPLLAGELRAIFPKRLSLPVVDAGHGIRATVIGASQFTVQVSGKTIYLPDRACLPVHNMPVVRVDIGPDDTASHILAQRIVEAARRMDIDPSSRLAISFSWKESPEYRRMEMVARAIFEAVAPEGVRREFLLLMIDGDVGKGFGHLLADELALDCPLVSIDGVQLQELDFVDVGAFVDPPGVVPVVIKSLLFS